MRRFTGIRHVRYLSYSGRHSNRLRTCQDAAQSSRRRDQPVSAAARGQSRGLVSVGRERRWRAPSSENKPILLSIGYSACHWCHVMAHESFEDTSTAALMNRVVRQHQGRSRRASRPGQDLSSRAANDDPRVRRLAPDHVPDTRRINSPFSAAPIFPRNPAMACRHFSEICSSAWPNTTATTARRSRRRPRSSRPRSPPLSPQPVARRHARRLARCCGRARRLEYPSIRDFGGFSDAPKFPHPTSIERCLRQWHATAAGPSPTSRRLYMASLTLTRMAEGGLYDQLGGGFARYSVDGAWMIPHFEKMLYDNAQLLCEYCARPSRDRRGAVCGRSRMKPRTGCCATCVRAAGSFYSSLDADSEGHEGSSTSGTAAKFSRC